MSFTEQPSISTPEPVIRSRWRPAAWHLFGGTLLVGAGTFGLVRLWYPVPYAELAGGLELLGLLVAVDIALGPALSFVAASPGKLRRVFARDLAFIVTVQVAAAAYGLNTMAVARPVGLVFEVDQMRLISAADIQPSLLPQAPPELRSLPWTGPRLMAAVKPTDSQELLQAVELAVSGVELSMLPRHWRTYESQRAAVLARSRPIADLLARYPDARAEVEASARAASAALADLRFLPLRARRADGWVTLVAAPDARLVGHLMRAAPP